MRIHGNYITAALLLLLTVPMYRYIYVRATAPPVVLVAPVVQGYGSTPPQRQSFVRAPRPVEFRHVALAGNDRCIGGMVVRVEGNEYTPIKEHGAVVPCSGHDSHRVAR